MYKKVKRNTTSMIVNKSYVAESIERRIERMVVNKEPITDSAPLIYTERKEGVKAEHDIRTDRFDIAIDAMDAVSKTFRAQREGLPKDKINEAMDNMKKEDGDGKAESAQTTE